MRGRATFEEETTISHLVLLEQSPIENSKSGLQAVEAACTKLKGEFRRGRKSQRFDYGSGDCEHVMSFSKSGYIAEVGLVKKKKGGDNLFLQYDPYDRVLSETLGDKAQTFGQLYQSEKLKIEARRHGYTVQEKKLKDGSIRLSVGVGG